MQVTWEAAVGGTIWPCSRLCINQECMWCVSMIFTPWLCSRLNVVTYQRGQSPNLTYSCRHHTPWGQWPAKQTSHAVGKKLIILRTARWHVNTMGKHIIHEYMLKAYIGHSLWAGGCIWLAAYALHHTQRATSSQGLLLHVVADLWY